MSRLISQTSGQASVEAAFLMPTLLLALGMLLQPACLLYTRMVMVQAAAETARVLITAPDGQDGARTFCLRRLEAVPDIALFHIGGSDGWDISLSSDAGEAEVSITGRARPLPVFGLLAGIVLEHDGEGIVLNVSHAQRLRPAWLGGGPDDWAGIWNA